MKLNLKKNTEALRVPSSCIPLLSDADASDLRVLLYAADIESRGEKFDVEKAAHTLMISAGEVNSSLKFWYGAGVMKKTSQKVVQDADEKTEEPKNATRTRRALPEKRMAHFTANELCEIAEENAEFKVLLDEAQQTAGWIFNTAEIEIIASLYANLRLSSEYILALIGYYVCRREMSLRYLEKVAYAFIDEGVDTPAALEEKLRYLERHDGFCGMVRKMFGLGTRELSEKESKMISAWTNEYKYGEDIIKAAYEVTVNNTGKASLSYANTVLKNWHDEGVRKLSDVAEKRAPKKEAPKTTKQGTATARSFNVDDALAKALKRSYKTEDKG